MNRASQSTTGASDCPRCHAPAAFGPRAIFGQYWMTRCAKCPYTVSEPLPQITKQIIYLDQLVISNGLFSKDPRWSMLLQRLRWVTALQVIVCPYSKVHVEESLLAESSRDELKALYRELSGGTGFLTPHEIEQNQLLGAIGQYLRGNKASPQWDRPRPWREYSKDDPHRWTCDIAVYADFPTDLGRVDRLKARKAELHNDLEAVAGHWQSETNSFAADVKREASGYADTLLEKYRELAAERSFAPDTPPGMQPGVQLVHWLAGEVRRARPDEPDPVGVVEQFFQTKLAMEVPFQYIASRLWATVTRSGADPSRSRKPKSSDGYDVTAISRYAPYCDAMVVDNEFCAMARQKNIDVEGRFGVRLFSARTLDGFLDYLEDLAANVPRNHRAALKGVFPHLACHPWLKTDADGMDAGVDSHS